MINVLPFDLADPPEDPPAGCTELVMWATARVLFADHEPVDGQCEFCGDPRLPCPGRELAVQGLQTACGVETGMSVYWLHLAKIRAEESTR